MEKEFKFLHVSSGVSIQEGKTKILTSGGPSWGVLTELSYYMYNFINFEVLCDNLSYVSIGVWDSKKNMNTVNNKDNLTKAYVPGEIHKNNGVNNNTNGFNKPTMDEICNLESFTGIKFSMSSINGYSFGKECSVNYVSVKGAEKPTDQHSYEQIISAISRNDGTSPESRVSPTPINDYEIISTPTREFIRTLVRNYVHSGGYGGFGVRISSNPENQPSEQYGVGPGVPGPSNIGRYVPSGYGGFGGGEYVRDEISSFIADYMRRHFSHYGDSRSHSQSVTSRGLHVQRIEPEIVSDMQLPTSSPFNTSSTSHCISMYVDFKSKILRVFFGEKIFEIELKNIPEGEIIHPCISMFGRALISLK